MEEAELDEAREDLAVLEMDYEQVLQDDDQDNDNNPNNEESYWSSNW